MSTREEMRRELKDLAKLASLMPKERPADRVAQVAEASGGSRVTVPPAVASVAPSWSVPPPPRSPASVPPVTLPPLPVPRLPPHPRASSLIPPAAAVPSFGPPAPEASAWRKSWGLLAAGGTLLAAMVGGLALGQMLTSGAPAAGARTTDPAAAAAAAVDPGGAPGGDPSVAVAAPVRPAGTVPVTSADDLPPAIVAPAVTITSACPPAAPVATHATRPSRRATPSAGRSSGRSSSAARSLDDLIRKAALSK